MKIKKHVLACGLVAGLAGFSGVGASETSTAGTQLEVGYWMAKQATEEFELGEDAENIVQAGSQASGAVIGAAAGAVLGAKIGLAFGVIGGVVGAFAGAA